MSGCELRRRFVCEGLEPRTLLAAILSNTTTPGTISVPGEVDSYEFDAAAGERIVLSLSEVTPAYTPYIELHGPNGALVATAQGAAGALIDAAAPTTGSYSARVFQYGNNGTGEYLLRFIKLPHAGPSAPDPFDGDGGEAISNRTAEASIDSPGDFDVYFMEAAAGDRLVMSVSGITPTYVPFMALYGPGGAQIATGQGARSALIEAVAPSAGRYAALVFEYGDDGTGDYLFHSFKIPHPGTETPNPFDGDGGALVSNTSVAASVDVPGDIDAYFIDASAGERLVLSVSGITPTYVAFAALYGPGGAKIATGQGAHSALIEAVAPSAGTYTVLVFEYGNNQAGDYLLHFAKLPHTDTTRNPFDGDGGLLASNTTTAASIDQIGDFDLYLIDAAAGERIILSVGGVTPAYEPYLALYGPDGAQIAIAQGANSAFIERTAPTTGRYAALVLDYGNDESGDYLLHFGRMPHTDFAPNPFDGDGGVLVSNTTVAASIDAAGDLDFYSLQAAAGERIVLTLGDVTPAYQPYMSLYGPGGALLSTQFGAVAAMIETVAPASGTYNVLVADYGNDQPGDYHLHYAKLPYTGPAVDPFDGDGGVLTLTSTTTSTIDAPGDFDLYSIPVVIGEQLFFSVTEGAATPGYAPYIALYGPDGAVIRTAQGVATASIETTAAATGTYTLLVFDYGADNPGDYSLRFVRKANVMARMAFYNNSSFDTAGGDDGAIALDKAGRLPGQAAGFGSVTSFTRGLNGVMMDVATLTGDTLTAADFTFKAGTDANPANWAAAPAPVSIAVRKGAGVAGADRVVLTWADNAIKNQWLQVTLAANDATNLVTPHVFYFGNLVGDATGDLRVNALDLSTAKRGLNTTSPLAGREDITRDGRVNALDLAAIRANLNRSLGAIAAAAAPAAATTPPTNLVNDAGASRRPWDQASADLFQT